MKRGGGSSKKYIVKFGVDDPISNTYDILSDLVSKVKLDPEKIKIVGIEGNPDFKEALMNKILSLKKRSPNLTRFSTNNGYVSETQIERIMAEAAVAKLEQESKLEIEQARSAVQKFTEDSALLEAMFSF